MPTKNKHAETTFACGFKKRSSPECPVQSRSYDPNIKCNILMYLVNMFSNLPIDGRYFCLNVFQPVTQVFNLVKQNERNSTKMKVQKKISGRKPSS